MQELQEAKQAEFGKIPLGWKILTLKEIVDSYKNGIYKKPQYYGRGFPSIRMFNIKNGKIDSVDAPLLEVTQQELSDYGLHSGDILINRVNTRDLVGKAGVVRDGLGTVTFESKNIRVRISPEKSDPYFLIYFFNSTTYYRQIHSNVKGSIGQSTINQEDLNNILVLLPPILEQKKIASILSKIDELVQKTNQVIEQTQRLRKGLMQRLLTKGTGHTSFKKTSIGEIPESWNVASLQELCSIRIPDKISSMLYIGLEHIGQSDNNLVSKGDIKNFSSNKHVFHKGDILYGKLRPLLNKVYLAEEDGYSSTDILPLVIKRGILGMILLWTLSSDEFVNYADSTSAGTKMPRTSWNSIKHFIIRKPPIEEQMKIVDIISNVTKKFYIENSYHHRLKVLKKGLMQKLLTGKIRLKV